MKKITIAFSKSIALFCFVVVCFIKESYAQDVIWERTNPISSYTSITSKTEAPTFNLKVESLEKQLDQIDENKKGVLYFPVDNGVKPVLFEIRETKVMHPALEKKFPNIKSYKGVSLDNLNRIIQFTYSPNIGFYGVLEKNIHEKIEIKPFSKSSFYEFKKTNSKDNKSPFACHTEDRVKQELSGFGVLDRNVDDGHLRRYRLALSVSGEYSQTFLDGTELDDTERKTKVLLAMVNSVNRLNGIFERDLGVTMQLIENNDLLIYLNPSTDPYLIGNGLGAELSTAINSTINDSDYDVGHLFHKENAIYGNAGCIACVCTNIEKGTAYSVHRSPEADGMNLLAAHEFGHQFGAYHTQSSSNCRSGINSEVEPGSGSTIMSYAGICSPNVQEGSDDYFNYTSIRDIAIWTIDNSNCAELIPSNNTAPTVNAGLDYTIPKSTPFVLEGVADDSKGNENLTYCWEQNDPENPNSSNTPSSTRAVGPMFRSLPPNNNEKRYFPNLVDVVSNNLTPTWEVLPSISRALNFVLTVRDNDIDGGQVTSDAVKISVDGNSGPFVVTSQQNSLEVWRVGEDVTVTWDVAGTNLPPINTSDIEILLSIDGGKTFVTTLITTANDGEETFSLPDVDATTEARVMIKSVGNVFFAVNQQSFTIQKSEYIILSESSSINICDTENAEFNLEYKTFLGFDEAVNLSVSNLPNGVSASFSEDTFSGLNVSGIPFSITLTGISSLELGDYTFNVSGLSSSNIEKNITLSFTVFTVDTTTLSLIVPSNNSDSQEIDVEFNWMNDDNAVSYIIEIATDDAFNNVIDSAIIESATYISSSIENNKVYYWRVKIINPCSTSNYSEVYTFSSQCSIPEDFNFVSVGFDEIEMTWKDNAVSDSWIIEYGVSGFVLGEGVILNLNLKEFKAESLNTGTPYDFYVKSNCSIGGSSSNIGPFTVSTNSDYCNGDHFYDTGGVNGNYQNNENITTKIYPDSNDKRVRVIFNSFETEGGYDYMYIYDGENEEDNLLGRFTGNELQGQEFLSRHDSGALTFVFISDNIVDASGWDATVICEDKPNCLEPTNFRNTSLGGKEATFEWIPVGDDANWELEYALSGFVKGNGITIAASESSATLLGLVPLTAYDVYIRTVCDDGGFSESIGPFSFITLELCPSPTDIQVTELTNDSATMTWVNSGVNNSSWEIEYGINGFVQGLGTVETVLQNENLIENLISNTDYQVYVRSNCDVDGFSQWSGPFNFKTTPDYCNGDHFYDSGGEFGNYSNGENQTTVIFPKTSEERIKVVFNSFLLETCCDRLNVYDGPDSASPFIGTYTTNPGVLASSHESGALTFVFTSDSSVTYHGWDATVICEDRPNCIAPNNFSFSNISGTQVDLAWSQDDSESNWTIEYGFKGFVIGTGIEITSTTNKKTIVGLIPSTEYDVYVKANCAVGGFSDLIGPITFSTIELCPTPTNLNLGLITKNSAELNWDTVSNATEWEIEYNANYFNPGTGAGTVVTSLTNSLKLENLLPGTLYYAYVRSNCDTEGYSNWSDYRYFVTEVACAVPDNFIVQNITKNSAELDWDTISNATEWEIEYNSNYFNPGIGSGAIVTSLTNSLKLENLLPDTLYYVYVRSNCDTEGYSNWSDYRYFRTEVACAVPDNFIVQNITKNSAELNWDIINNATEWEIEYSSNYFNPGTGAGTVVTSLTNSLKLENLLPDTLYYAYVRSNCDIDGYSHWIDAFFITEVACAAPSSFIIQNVTKNSAELNWDIINNATEWEIEYHTSYFNPGEGSGIVVTSLTNSLSLESLLPETLYYVYIRSNCSLDGYSNWSGFYTFLTELACVVPVDVSIINIGETSAELSWDEDDNVTEWEIEYNDGGIFNPGTGVGTVITSSTNSITIDDLNSSTRYYAYVRSNCDTDGYSDWSNWVMFETSCAISANNNYIVNGSFECGSLIGWTLGGPSTFNACRFNYTVLENSNTVCTIVDQIAPTDGNYAAFTSFDGDADTTYQLSQIITIPDDIVEANAAVISFDFKVNYSMIYNNPSQERIFTVRFTDLSGTELFKVNEVRFGLLPNEGSIDRTFSEDILPELLPYAGASIIISFEAYVPESSTGPSKSLIDNVSLIIDKVLSNDAYILGDNQLSIYPIPNSGVFTIDNKNGGEIDVIELFDVSGRRIQINKLSKPVNKVNVAFKDLNAGVYFVKVHVYGEIDIKRIVVE